MQSFRFNPKKPSKRVDLSKRTLLMLLVAVLLVVSTLLLMVNLQVVSVDRPGTPIHQGSAIIGFILLCIPALFSIVKRSGFAENPPQWFVSHVLCSTCGVIFILLHAAGGNFLSVPGFILFLLLVIVIQGFLSRALLASSLSNVFAGKTVNFKQVNSNLQDNLRKVIAAKTELLNRLDPSANEALFSVNLTHWIRHPFLAFRYMRLAKREADLVGTRKMVSIRLAWWRRFHIFLGSLFVLGMFAHVLVVTFFAGYVAGGSDIYWWHVSDWGTQWSNKP